MSSLCFSGSRGNMSQINGNSRRPTNLNRIPSVEKPTCAQHDDLIKYIFESWNKVSQEVDKNTTMYYKEETHNLKDFKPFDLEAYWGRKLYQTLQQPQHS